MIPRAAELFEHLESQKGQFLGTLDAFSPEQRDFRPQPRAWNALQVGQHVVLAEQRTADAIKQHRGMRSGKRSPRYWIGNALLQLVLRTGLRVRNPVPEAAPDDDVDLDQLLQAWEKARFDLEAVLSELKDRGLGYAAYKHPIAGPFNVEQALEFLVAHLNHHLRQLERLQRYPSFPSQS